MDHNQLKINSLTAGIGNFIAYFLKRWWIFLIAGVLGGILGIVYATMQKPVYKSRLTFALEDNGGGLSGALNLAAQFGINLGGTGKDIFSGDNIIAILSSRRIIEDVLLSRDTIRGKEVTLADRYLQIGKLEKFYTNHKRLGTVRFPAGLPREKYTYHQDSVLFVIYNSIIKNALLVEKPDRKFNLYTIEFKSQDEKYAKIFVERLLSSAIQFYTELRTKRSRQTIDILENQIARIKGGALGAISRRADIQDANMNPAFADQSAKLQQYQVDISAYGGAYAEVFKNLEIARYQYLQDIPLLQVVDAPRYPMENLKKGRKIMAIYFGLFFVFATFVVLYIRKFIESFNVKDTKSPQ